MIANRTHGNVCNLIIYFYAKLWIYQYILKIWLAVNTERLPSQTLLYGHVKPGVHMKSVAQHLCYYLAYNCVNDY